MGTVSFQLTSVTQETVAENVGQQGAAPQAPANTNQTAVAPQDTVALSAIPPEPLVPFVVPVSPIQPFPGFINEAGAGGGQNNTAANNATPAQAPPATLPPNPPINLNAPQAPSATAPALDPPGTVNLVVNAGSAVSQAQLTPDQELVQLDQTLKQLGIDPQSISLFNRMALLVYAQDPTALQNLVHALQTVDQQLGQLTGLANTNGAQAQVQPAAQTAQNVAQQLPQAPVQAQAQPQAQPTTGGNNFEVIAAQLNLTEVQGSVTTQAPASNTNSSGAAQAPQTTAQFQELQLNFTALEIQGYQAPSNNTANTNTNAQGQTLNVTV